MQALPGRILPLELPPPAPGGRGLAPLPERGAPRAPALPPCGPGRHAPLALAAGGAAAGCAVRAGRRRGRRRAAPRAARGGRGGAEPGTPAWERVAELERAVARLEAEKRRLEEELQQRGAAGEGLEGAAIDGAPGGGEAGGPEDAPPGPFRFPTADLPRQLEYVRVVAPGEMEVREACGDWLSLFRNAAPYIASFRGGVVVVHVPSFLLDEEWREAFKGIMEDVAFCSLLGLRTVLVTSVELRLWRRLGEAWGEPRALPGGATKVGNRLPGLAIDERALEIAKQEAGLARVEVEGALSAGFEKRSMPGSGGGKATSAGIFSLRSAVSVVSSTNFFTASPLGVRGGVDYGYAGVVRSVNEDLLRRRLGDGDIVSLTPLGTSPNGEVFYVSSEELAAAVARRMQAMKLVYITRGQRLIDVRHGRVVPGVQQHDAQALLGRLEGAGAAGYSEEERGSEWFSDFVRHLRLLVGAISPRGARRGHLVDPVPGALLQEFYTTDGSGTCVAQDLYQGLGRAKLADADSILALLREDWEARELPGAPPAEAVEAGCAAGEFFVWRRDEAVLGCAQLVARRAPPPLGLVAELRCFALAEPLFATHAGALFGYAERAAVEGGAAWLLARGEHDAERAAWLAQRGFRAPSAAEAAALPGGGGLLKPLGAGAAQEARECLEAFTEEQRMWGGLAA